jgi:Ca2+-binding EF-hand superfamily protein
MAASSHMAYEQWFREADKDKNGYLTSREIKKALKSKGYKTSRKALKVIQCVSSIKQYPGSG